MKSADTLRAVSTSSGSSTVRRASPAASVSSVSGLGVKYPWPAENRAAHRPRRTRADPRGLSKKPYRLW